MQVSSVPELMYLGFRRVLPLVALQPFIRCYWSIGGGVSLSEPREELFHPDGGSSLLFNFSADYRLDGVLQPPIIFDATYDQVLRLKLQGPVDMLGVRFRPYGAWPFLAQSMHECVTVSRAQVVDAPVWQQLHSRLAECVDTQARYHYLDQWFLQQRPGLDSDAVLTQQLVSMIARQAGVLRIDTLAQHWQLHPRKLERLFRRYVGVTARDYAQLCRLVRAKALLKHAPVLNLAELAALCGFYDQAQLTKQFKSVYHTTPMKYRQQKRNSLYAGYSG